MPRNACSQRLIKLLTPLRERISTPIRAQGLNHLSATTTQILNIINTFLFGVGLKSRLVSSPLCGVHKNEE